MNKKPDLVSIGDASVDVFITPEESEAFCDIDKERCWICFNYADKIPVPSLAFSVGGNAANNAVGSSRLGLKAALVLTLGDDDTGERILAKVKKEGVQTDFVTVQKGTSSNYSTVINYSGERTIFVYHYPRKYEFPKNLPAVEWAYLTSMGENFAPFYEKVVDWVKRNKIKLAFNPGSYQFKAGTKALREVFSVSEVVFVNRQEAGDLTGIKPKDEALTTEDERKLLQGLRGLGPRIAVITDGHNGSFAFDGKRYFKCGILPIDAIERTGAGDAFGTEALAALIWGKGLDEALLWGTINAASVIGHIGPQEGLLKKEELPLWLERAKSMGVKTEEF